MGRSFSEFNNKIDEFLDVYSFYLHTEISLVRDEARLKAYELHVMDPDFFPGIFLA